MNKNNGIKILAGSVVFAVIMILINSRHSAPVNNNTPNPNNFGEAIASQFNDNIRDVSARLLETEKK
ncbi:TPA: TIGR03752 family integrating conjugative element protein, partial [Legionella pneumophila]|nr:TIGR03752 family integrating conjugative element protein [Legionella pneumophila subsp. pneumophila]HDV5714011.1 TIGR03752 family integrating conjugative element protein [Legionella pneumophila]HAT9588461.1 TIGR03752 family integrating conjugative element protein [Legionella pneumophila subsp. pneumophila]HAT9814463.1 TIGR03752 family integrating conjugative element protein [Legionella pneumophila subsp. pneumophila]HDV5941399.1 TIGR03752 family integrating conjugative element protein [Legio